MTPPHLYKTPTALPPIGDGPPSLSTVSKSLNVRLLAADNTSTTLGEALARTERKKVLVVLIRHFYCSNCQEYIRQMSKSLGPGKLARRDTSIIVIGCGTPSLITRYVKVTQCAYPVYADPTTRLYKLLGTHRTVSMGTRRPSYVQRSLFMDCVKSVVQGIKRIAAGDLRRAGSLRVNGGEFLFWRDGGGRVNVGLLGQQRPPPKRLRRVVNVHGEQQQEQQKRQGVNEEDDVGVAALEEEDEEDEEYDLWGERKWSDSGLNGSQSHGYLEKKGLLGGVEGHRDEKYGDWKMWWCHRMRNSRDHTEIDELKKTMGLSDDDGEIEESRDGNGAHADVLQGSKETTGKLQASALTQSKQSWMRMLSSTSRKRKQTTVVTGNGSWEKTKHQNGLQNGLPNGLHNGVSENRVRPGEAIG